MSMPSEERNSENQCGSLATFHNVLRPHFVTALFASCHSALAMSQRKLALRGLLLLCLLGLSSVINAWTDKSVLETLQKRALFGGTACTLAANYGYVRAPRCQGKTKCCGLELDRGERREKSDDDWRGQLFPAGLTSFWLELLDAGPNCLCRG